MHPLAGSAAPDPPPPPPEAFEAFFTGTAPRLLHAATLLTTERPDRNPRAQALVASALAGAYARWDRLRDEDPWELARRALVLRFARSAWRHRRPRGGALSRLTPRERLVVVALVYERMGEEQLAALLGLSPHRVRSIRARAAAALLTPEAHRTPWRARAPRLLGAGR
ncbi:sigma factor-like helix-turn-helix DNA-binding protein [Streptomyces sp. NPDC047097]|uniref:sigma factor-like helix-turn-helix DNA-binding protein n=1 Tax=Streptomyces sp. NPDC047097 TaxID=3155260 RepID=UPI0033FD3163